MRSNLECGNCGTSFRQARAWQRFCSVTCQQAFHRVGGERECYYCGAWADTEDHVPPRIDRQRLCDLGLVHPNDCHVVWACKECSCGLGSRSIWKLTDRRKFIARWLARRYRKELAAPDWSDSEIASLEPWLQRYIIHKQSIKEFVQRRVRHASR